MKLLRWSILLLSVSLLAASCGTARYVVLDASGGAVSSPDNSSGNRTQAISLIRQHCPKGYAITKESEVPVGSVTSQDISTEPNIFEGTDVSQTTRTRIQTEWRIDFICK